MRVWAKWAIAFFGVLTAVLVLALCGSMYLLLHRVEGQYFDSNGVRIHYTVEGKGDPLILIHGVAAQADWNWRIPGVTGMLAKHFQVISLDLRGHGLSGKPVDPAAYGANLTEDVIRLMDHLSIQRAYVAGYSLGGYLTVKLIADHPDRLRAAAICAAGWRNPDDTSPLPNPYQSPDKNRKEVAVLASNPVRISSTTSEASPLSPVEVDKSFSHSVEPSAQKKSLFHRIRNWVADRFINKSAIKALKKSFPQLAVPVEKLEANHVPTFCIIGTKDGLLPMAQDLEKHMTSLEMVYLPGADHFSTPFNREFKQQLLKFFLEQQHAAG